MCLKRGTGLEFTDRSGKHARLVLDPSIGTHPVKICPHFGTDADLHP